MEDLKIRVEKAEEEIVKEVRVVEKALNGWSCGLFGWKLTLSKTNPVAAPKEETK